MGTFIRELIHVGVYKRSQGRITRQVTAGAVILVIALGLWRMSTMLVTSGPVFEFGLPGLLLVAGAWVSYRLVNVPGFADFLIAVEAEMNKVSWPTRLELIRASLVVIVVIFVLAFTLALFDMFWGVVFQRVLHIL